MITGIFAIAFVAVYFFFHGESTSAIHEIFYVLLAGFAAICIGIDVLLHRLDDAIKTQKTAKPSGSSAISAQDKRDIDLGGKPKREDDPWGNKSFTEKRS